MAFDTEPPAGALHDRVAESISSWVRQMFNPPVIVESRRADRIPFPVRCTSGRCIGEVSAAGVGARNREQAARGVPAGARG